jgi:uracil-DNA glycosylase family 4
MQQLRSCKLCPRLYAHRQLQKSRYPDYHCLPVASFGVENPRLLIVGLAPGLHGANATGRAFTGDASGETLFQCLYKFGFASHHSADRDRDEMQLSNCRITNAVKCLPPENKPDSSEINRCNPYLRDEISQLRPTSVILALGTIAHRAVLKAVEMPQSKARFGHLAEFELPDDLHLIDSYHCSRYNMNTGRLTLPMFESVFERIEQLLQ